MLCGNLRDFVFSSGLNTKTRRRHKGHKVADDSSEQCKAGITKIHEKTRKRVMRIRVFELVLFVTERLFYPFHVPRFGGINLDLFAFDDEGRDHQCDAVFKRCRLVRV